MSGRFPVTATYEFVTEKLTRCRHCHRELEEHGDGQKCLFEPTVYTISDLRRFLDELLRVGGEITITTAEFVLKQTIIARSYDLRETYANTELVAAGEICLEKRNAPKRT